MDFIQTANKQVDKFGPGKHGFSAGDPGGGVQATFLSSSWFDGVQQEIINAIEAAGLVPTDVDLSQLRKAIDILVRRRAGLYCIAGGTVDAITGDFTPDVAALVDGMTVLVRAAGANTSTAPTFKADGTAAVTIVKENNQALLAGDIPGAGYWAVLVYDATLARWVLTNPAAKVSTGYMFVRDEKAQGTGGGSSVAGVQTRTLNAVQSNTIPGASLAANQITLPAGTYRVRAVAGAIVNQHRAYLYNVTDAAILLLGRSVNGIQLADADPCETVSEVGGRFTLAAAKVIELRHRTSEVAATTGLGAPMNADGVEVYSTVEITKE